MRYNFALPILGMALPAVMAQGINKAAVAGVPVPTYTPATTGTAETIRYDATSAYASVKAEVTANPSLNQKRDWVCTSCTETTSTAAPTSTGPPPPPCLNCGDCSPQATGAGVVPTPSDAATFSSYPAFAQAALSAPVPNGYSNTFTNLNASNSAYNYMGYTTLQAYDVNVCASKCNAITGCMSFNIYFERDPLLDAGANCRNPAPTTNIKCVFWGGPVVPENANNYGQTRADFQVVIAGSNGYVNNTITTCDGWNPGQNDHDKAIDAPYDCNGQVNTYMGFKLFTGVPFDVQLCKTACESQNVYNLAHPPTDGTSVQTCQFFNTYLLSKNGVAIGQYCSMYTRAWDISYATNSGYTDNGDVYTIMNSFSYSNSTMSGQVCPTAKPSSSVSSTSSSTSTVSSASSVISSASSVMSSVSSVVSSVSSVASSASSTSSVVTTSNAGTLASSSTSKPASTSSSASSVYTGPTSSGWTSSTTKASSTTSSIITSSAKPTTSSAKPTTNSSSKPSSSVTTCSAAQATGNSNPPSNSCCGKAGKNSQQPVAIASGASCPTKDLCAWNCLMSNSCKSFSWVDGCAATWWSKATDPVCHHFGSVADSANSLWWSAWLWGFSSWSTYDEQCYKLNPADNCISPTQPKPEPKPYPSNGGKPKLSKCVSHNDCSCLRCIDFWSIGNGICI